MIALLTWIVRILALLLLVRLVVKFFLGHRQVQGRKSRTPLERSGGALVRDPQCGTYFPKTRALTVGAGDRMEYFCSTACRDAYLLQHAHKA